MNSGRWRVFVLGVVMSGTVVGGTRPADAGPSAGALPGDFVQTVRVAGRAGVPLDAEAVALNVTAVSPAGVGYLTVYPCGQPAPEASNLNVVADIDVPNAVISRLSAEGTVCIYSSNHTDVLVDVAGYFPAGSSIDASATPVRELDTRSGAKPTAGSITKVGFTGLPAGSGSVAFNLTAAEPEAAGFVTAYPCDQTPPEASSLNVARGETRPNLVIARLAGDGTTCLFSSVATHLLVDRAASFPADGAGLVTVQNPQRILDTRRGTGAPTAPLAAGQPLSFAVRGTSVVPAHASAVVLNVTATGASAAGFVTVYPCGAVEPEASNLNFRAGVDVANLVIAKIGNDGRVCARSSAGVELLADVAGYVTVDSTYTPILNPVRLLDTRYEPPIRCTKTITVVPGDPVVTIRDRAAGGTVEVEAGWIAGSLRSELGIGCNSVLAVKRVTGQPDTLVEVGFDGSERVVFTYPVGGNPTFAVLDDGRIFAGDNAGIYDVTNAKTLYTFPREHMYPLTIQDDGYFVLVKEINMLWSLRLSTGELEGVPQFQPGLVNWYLSPQGAFVAGTWVVNGTNVVVIETWRGEFIEEIPIGYYPWDNIPSVSWYSENELLVCSRFDPPFAWRVFSGVVEVFDVPPEQCPHA